ncbi:MAG: carboxypeptidase-like regulatory domain-containing protein [Chitinophagaceae bacterium]
MTDQQNAKLSMYNVVASVMDDNTAKVATVAALVTVAANFKTTAEAISNTAEQQATITTGVTPDKNATRESLRNTTVNIAGILYAYAVSVNNIILQGKSKITYSALRDLKDDELGERAQSIHDEANAVIASLPPFGITAAVLTSYQTLIDSYEAKSPAPRAAQSQQVALTTQLKDLFKQADSTLKNSMDKLMLNFKTTDPQFFNTYTAAREIIDAGSATTKISGTVTNIASAVGIAGAVITVEDQSYTATSEPDGSYELIIPVPGTYNIFCNHPGYQQAKINAVEVTLGVNTKLNIELTT